ncbi:MAG TPA: type II toxin-antitoxin system RelE/ParE family toxin [Terracidiphilus sp.]|nr:type II toxin-antitoxin system RelE/ParE family toxin [Terracidiphilus sp.]
MGSEAAKPERVFKTAWFSKAARKAKISDEELCTAIRQVMLGQAADLGGGVFKKRLDRNRSRSIILAKGGRRWVFEYLFAKKDRENIENDELVKFRKLARVYEVLTEQQLKRLVENSDWMEICHGS